MKTEKEVRFLLARARDAIRRDKPLVEAGDMSLLDHLKESIYLESVLAWILDEDPEADMKMEGLAKEYHQRKLRES